MLPADLKCELREIATKWPEYPPAISPSRSAWFGNTHKQVFRELLVRKPDGVYMEIGTWTGNGSTRFVVDHFHLMDVICIDTFEGSVEHHRKEEWKKIASQLWEHFCSHHWSNRHRIYPFRQQSLAAMHQIAANTSVKPDFIYIDGAHDEESVYLDVSTAIKLFPKAVVFGDDYVAAGSQGHPGVYRGLARCIAEGLITVNELQNKQRVWWVTRNLPKHKH